MKNERRINVVILLMSLIISIVAQNKQVRSEDFWGQTIDIIHWDTVEYMCSISPLSRFEGYKSIFGWFTTNNSNPEAPVTLDKNYKAIWIIKGNALFLFDIEIFDENKNLSEKKFELEKLTNNKFIPENNQFGQSQFSMGIMLASWFSGSIFIKRQPEPGESYCDCVYRRETFKELIFKNGILTQQNMAFFMNTSIDGIEIINNPSLYIKSQISHYDYHRISYCEMLLKDKFTLDDNQVLSDVFKRTTNDELLWDNTIYLCSESPLSYFDNYERLYPMTWPYGFSLVLKEKNYIAKWTIVNNKLYIYDIVFHAVGENNENYEKIDRYQTIENFTGRKFQQIPSFDRKALFADWYSGTVFFKRIPVHQESFSDYNYNCEPFYKLVVEKGKIKSMEKTTYMITN